MGGDAFKTYVNSAPLLIDFLLNNILSEKSSAKTPQEKSELVAKVIDVLKDINNKIILFNRQTGILLRKDNKINCSVMVITCISVMYK